ncbi:uncharacterized mitochondrial protein-like protein [Tanacetum coccineum]|uniref:Uncharacterized mitochondrial protein-like protein n=1 Tax=Tanacetum coccineum TaxID=301880 RepID=A0ABQ4X535_9ASTR
MVKPVWNNAQRVNHQNFAKKTHPCAKKNLVPRAVLMKSDLVSINTAKQNISKTTVLVNTARQVNAAHSKTTVNAARPMSYLSKTAHSTVKRLIHKNTSFKNININQRVNTVRGKKINTARPKVVVNAVKGNNFNAVKASACWVWKPKHKVLDHVSKHKSASITLKSLIILMHKADPRNMSYLTDYEEIDGGYVAFGGNPKGRKITGKSTIKTGNLDFENVYFVRELKFNLFSISQMCDKKNSVLFNDTECIVLSPNFKLIDESQVLLRVPRKNNMYSVDLKNIVPKGGLTCLFAKATSDESKLWHRRPGHLNFKTMNKLVKGNLFVQDDYSRFTWVFFLATKDETSGILKSFITGIENLVDHKVKVIRCDNGTEFKNREMNQFCEIKGILRQFSVARTPQQNGVAERRNRTLIEAARTMLADSKLPTTFWLKRSSYTALLCANYECCNHLGKFDGKADEGFFVGYSLNSKAFRVFNSRTRIVEENLHIRFSESTPNVVGSRLDWLFDIDALTRTMNYEPLVAGTQSNGFADPKTSHNDGSKPRSDDGKKVDEDPRKDSECKDQDKENNVNSTNNVNTVGNVNTVSSTINAARTNEVNVVGVKTSIELLFDPNMPALEDDSIFEFSRDDEDDGAVTDMNNLDTTIQVRPNPTTRIHKDHPLDQVIRDFQSAIQKRKMSKNLEEHGKNPKRIEEIMLFLAYASFKDLVVYQMDVKSAFLYGNIEEEVYVCQPPGFEDPDFTDRVYKVEKALYGLHQAPRAWYETLSTYLLDNGFQRGKIDKTLFIKRHKGDILLVQVYVDDIIFGSTKKELCIAFEKLMHEKFQMSSMGELTFFLGLQVKQKKDGIFISQDKYVAEILKKFGFTEVKTTSTLMETQKPLLKDGDGEELYQVNQKISHLHAVKRIFSDYAGASLDRKSTTGGCQFLGYRLISWQCKKKTVVANSITEAEYVAASSCCGQVLWIQNQLLDYGKNKEKCKINDGKVVWNGIEVNTSDSKLMLLGITYYYEEGVDCLPNSTIFEQLTLMRKPKRKDTQVPQPSDPIENVVDEAVHRELGDSLVRVATTNSSLEVEQDSDNINKTQSKATPNESSSQGTNSGGGPWCQETMGDTIAQTRLKLDELMALCTTLQNWVLDLEKTKTTQHNEIASLKMRVKKLEKKDRSITHRLKRLFKVSLTARVESSDNEESLGEDVSKQGRIDAIDADEEITLVSVHDVNVSAGEEVFIAEQDADH